MRIVRVSSLMTLAAGLSMAQVPTITSVVNAAGGIVQPLPNGGIAQGAIFTVVGSNMGPATLSLDHSPFTSTRLLGTSVNITVKGTTVGMLMYYTSATQVAGLLPSNTPLGPGTVTVTYNGATSAAAPITVVRNNAGIFTTPSGGAGAAVVTFADYSVVTSLAGNPCGGPNTACGAANPNDTLILWLSGLGPVPAPDSSGPQPGNMADIPLKLFIGGVQAPVSYQGRSGCCIGLDQVIFTVPDNVATGCAVPLFIQIDNLVSNFTSLPVAKGSRNCTATNPGFTADTISALFSSGPITSMQVKLRRRPNNAGQNVDRADVQFQKQTLNSSMKPFALSLLDAQPLGTCTVANNPNLDLTTSVVTFQSGIDAGPSLTLSGPGGDKVLVRTVTPGQPTDYFLSIGPGYFSPGKYTVSGSGGADVGQFQAALTILPLPVWTNPSDANTVNRASGLTINWTGGASEYVAIQGGAFTDTSLNTGAVFSCIAAGEAGTFTIPANVLLALPAVAASPNGFVQFQPGTFPVTFTASGLSIGSMDFNANVSNNTTFK